MPIDIERFEEDSTDALRAGGWTNTEKLLSFLAASPDKAYSRRRSTSRLASPAGASVSYSPASETAVSSATAVTTGRLPRMKTLRRR